MLYLSSLSSFITVSHTLSSPLQRHDDIGFGPNRLSELIRA